MLQKSLLHDFTHLNKFSWKFLAAKQQYVIFVLLQRSHLQLSQLLSH